MAHKYKTEIKELYEHGHTHYAIAYKIKEWFSIKITEAQIEKLLSKPTRLSNTRIKLNKLKDKK